MGETSYVSNTTDLADRFHERWMTTHPFAATMYGIPGYDHLVPDDSEAGDQAWKAEVQGFLARLDQIDGSDLSLEDRITMGVLRSAAEQEIDVIESAALEHTVSAMPFADPASFLAVAARTVLVDRDAADSYVTRLEGAGHWIDQITDRLRAGASKGRLPIGPLVEQAVAWVDSVLADEVPAALLSPQPLAGWDGSAAWAVRRSAAAAQSVKPALLRWRSTLVDLLPECRDSDHGGLCHIPGGEADYSRYIRIHTTLPLSAAQLHQTGLNEIAALERRAVALGAELDLHGLDDVYEALRRSAGQVSPEESIAEAVAAIRRAEAAAPNIFPPPLPAPCEVTPMPAVVASAGTAPHYTPPRLDGGRPGTFWFNTERPTAGTGWDLEVVAFHEAVPGHHLQLSRVQLLETLPTIQRQRNVTVFSEGWGLYAEQLAEEAGLYADTKALLGAVSASLMRACRLVIDTGLHAFGWSRERAVDFFSAHTPMPAEFLAAEVDRYLVMPGQALSYLTGKLEILRHRERAEAALGSRFSLPAFHAALLDHGSIPMPVLTQSLEAWTASLLPAP
jgi:uncharacterized protein (DUF885 family)